MGRARRTKEQRQKKPSPPQITPPSSFFGPKDLPVRSLAVLLLLSVLAALIYANTFSVPFQFDDADNIVQNPWVKDLANFFDLSGSRYMGFLSFALNYSVGGLQVLGYHLVNLIIHIANGFLVYSLVLLLFKAQSQHSPLTTHDSQPTTASWIALAAALLFVAHPIQTQAVTYIVQRFASLVTLFYLFTVVCYLKWRLAPSETRSRFLWYGGAVLCTVLAMKTKENSFTLPFMILLVEGVFFRPFTRKRWIALIPFLLTLPIIPLSHPGAIGEGEAGFAQDTAEISRSGYLFTQFRVIVTYIRLLFLPIGQNLDYDYRIYHSILEPAVLLSFLFLLSIFILSLFVICNSRLTTQDSQLRLMGFGIVWFFLTLSIESSIIPIKDVIFEHRLYLPSVGFFMALSIGVVMGRKWLQRQGIPAVWGVIGFGVIVLVFSAMTYQRNHVWHDAMTLWQDVAKKAPQKPRGHNNLGLAYQDKGMLEAAIQEYLYALKIHPNYFKARNNLGSAYVNQGRFEEATQEFQVALKLRPDNAEVHYNLGSVSMTEGRLEEATQELQIALRLRPNYVKARNNLGTAFAMQGRFEEAIQEFQITLSHQPDYADAYYNLGIVYQNLEQLEKAIEKYQDTLKLKPDFAPAYYGLGNAYVTQGRIEEAIQAYLTTLRFQPNHAGAYHNLGNVYKLQGRIEAAIEYYKVALKLQPDLAEAHNGLSNAYRQHGRIDEAKEAFKQALKIKPNLTTARQGLESLSKSAKP